MGIYLIMLLFPGIDFSFRFKGLALILVLRLLVAGLFYLLQRKSDGIKKKVWMVLGALLSIVLFTINMTPAFLFRDYNGRPLTGPYKVAQADAILVDGSRLETFESDGSFREVPVHFYYPENAGELGVKTLPLIFFSHGAFGYYQSNSSTYMELASNGYVVVSLDHPYHSFFTKDTDGKTVIVDMEFFQNAMNIGNSDATEAEVYEVTSKWMELRLADMNFVLDTVKKAAGEGGFGSEWFFTGSREEIQKALKCVDTERIGLMGHSLGGATAVTVGRRGDVSAVIDFDGTMLGEEIGVDGDTILINEEPYTTPLLCFEKEDHHMDCVRAKEIGYVYANNVIMDNATEVFRTYFVGSEHMNFTDLPLFAPFLAKMLGCGTIDPAECIDQMNEITVRFFDCYLKGIGEFSVNEKY